MDFSVTLHEKGSSRIVKVKKGISLLEFLRDNKAAVSAPCGGKHKCGKCRVKVNGIAEHVKGKGSELLGDKLVHSGYRLACFNKIESDLEIFLDDKKESAKILTSAKDRKVKLKPMIKKNMPSLICLRCMIRRQTLRDSIGPLGLN